VWLDKGCSRKIFRAARNFEVRAGLQHNHRDGGRVRQRNYPALQVLYWF